MNKTAAIVAVIIAAGIIFIHPAHAFEKPDLSSYFQSSRSDQGSGRERFSSPSSWSEQAPESINEFRQQNRQEFQQRIETMQQSFQTQIDSFSTQPSFDKPIIFPDKPITPPSFAPKPVIPGNTIDTSTVLTQVFGTQAANFTPEQIQVLSQAVSDVGGAQNAQKIVIGLRDIFGAIPINSMITTSDPKEVAFVLNAVNNLGIENFENVVQVMGAYFGADAVQETFLKDPAVTVTVASEVSSIGMDKLEGYLHQLSQTLSMSDAQMQQNLQGLFINSPAYIGSFVNVINHMSMSIESVASGLRDFISVFGLDSVTDAFFTHPGGVIDNIDKIEAMYEGGVKGIPTLFSNLAQTLGVSVEEVVQPFGWILSSTNLVYFFESVNSLGIDRFIQYVAEAVTIYGGESVFYCLKDDIQTFSDVFSQIDSLGGLQAFVDSLSVSNQKWEVIYALQDMRISVFARFRPEDLAEVIQNRIANVDDGRPLAVVVYPTGDYNGALSNNDDVFHQIIQQGYRVMYYAVGTDTEAFGAMEQATHDGALPAEVLIVGGHGSQVDTGFGYMWIDPVTNMWVDEPVKLDFSDYTELTGLNSILAQGGTIILVSCSNGQGLNLEANMANMWAQAFPQAGHVFAPVIPTNIDSITFGPGGRITAVNFRGEEAYDAAQYDTYFTFSGEEEQDSSGELMRLMKQL